MCLTRILNTDQMVVAKGQRHDMGGQFKSTKTQTIHVTDCLKKIMAGDIIHLIIA